MQIASQTLIPVSTTQTLLNISFALTFQQKIQTESNFIFCPSVAKYLSSIQSTQFFDALHNGQWSHHVLQYSISITSCALACSNKAAAFNTFHYRLELGISTQYVFDRITSVPGSIKTSTVNQILFDPVCNQILKKMVYVWFCLQTITTSVL